MKWKCITSNQKRKCGHAGWSWWRNFIWNGDRIASLYLTFCAFALVAIAIGGGGVGCYILFTSSTCDGPGIMSVDSWTFTTQRMWNWTGYIVTEIKQNKDWRSGRPAKVSNPLSNTFRNTSPRKHSLTTPTWQTCYAVRITLMLYSHMLYIWRIAIVSKCLVWNCG